MAVVEQPTTTAPVLTVPHSLADIAALECHACLKIVESPVLLHCQPKPHAICFKCAEKLYNFALQMASAPLCAFIPPQVPMGATETTVSIRCPVCQCFTVLAKDKGVQDLKVTVCSIAFKCISEM